MRRDVEELERLREVEARPRAAFERVDAVPERRPAETVTGGAHPGQAPPAARSRVVQLDLADRAAAGPELLAAEHHDAPVAQPDRGDSSPGLAHRRQPRPSPAARVVAVDRAEV